MTFASLPDPTLLRSSLRANAAFSALSGAIFIGAGEPLGGFLGVAAKFLVGTGVSLLAFAAALVLFARSPMLSPAIARVFLAADLGWTVATGLLISLGIFTPHGAIAALAVSGAVMCFAVLQWVGIRRLGPAPLAVRTQS